MLISFLLSVFDFILSLIQNFASLSFFPAFDVLLQIFYYSIEIITTGMKIVSFFFNPGDLSSLCDIWLLLFTIDHSVEIVFFVLRKIPFLNIK